VAIKAVAMSMSDKHLWDHQSPVQQIFPKVRHVVASYG